MDADYPVLRHASYFPAGMRLFCRVADNHPYSQDFQLVAFLPPKVQQCPLCRSLLRHFNTGVSDNFYSNPDS